MNALTYDFNIVVDHPPATEVEKINALHYFIKGRCGFSTTKLRTTSDIASTFYCMPSFEEQLETGFGERRLELVIDNTIEPDTVYLESKEGVETVIFIDGF